MKILHGRCYCGKVCAINHEKVAAICCCAGKHNICNKKCLCKNSCIDINNHQERCSCVLCFGNNGIRIWFNKILII